MQHRDIDAVLSILPGQPGLVDLECPEPGTELLPSSALGHPATAGALEQPLLLLHRGIAPRIGTKHSLLAPLYQPVTGNR